MTAWLTAHGLFWPLAYLSLWATAALGTWLARDPVKRWLAALLLAEWLTHNLWLWRFGFTESAADGIGLTDILVMSGIGAFGLKKRSQTAQIIVVLFWARFAVQLADRWAQRPHHGWAFWAMLNVTFALMVLTLLGASAYDLAGRLGLGGTASERLRNRPGFGAARRNEPS